VFGIWRLFGNDWYDWFVHLDLDLEAEELDCALKRDLGISLVVDLWMARDYVLR